MSSKVERTDPQLWDRVQGDLTQSEKRGKPEPAAAVDLRAAYSVRPDEFQVLLIGKDGGVKLRQADSISAADLFALIDAMPMRKQEMRDRSE